MQLRFIGCGDISMEDSCSRRQMRTRRRWRRRSWCDTFRSKRCGNTGRTWKRWSAEAIQVEWSVVTESTVEICEVDFPETRHRRTRGDRETSRRWRANLVQPTGNQIEGLLECLQEIWERRWRTCSVTRSTWAWDNFRVQWTHLKRKHWRCQDMLQNYWLKSRAKQVDSWNYRIEEEPSWPKQVGRLNYWIEEEPSKLNVKRYKYYVVCSFVSYKSPVSLLFNWLIYFYTILAITIACLNCFSFVLT